MNTFNLETTFNLNSFTNLNCPKFGNYAFSSVCFPDGRKLFDKIFYMELDGKITAFKFIAWAMVGCSPRYNFMYLIQTPTTTFWINLADKAFFETLEQLLNGSGKYDIPKIWDYNLFSDNDKINRRDIGKERRWSFNQSYYYSDNRGVVASSETKIAYFMGVKNGIYVGLQQGKGHKNTPQEVLAERFNNREVIDFAEPTTIEIKIEIPSTEYVTKRIVLE